MSGFKPSYAGIGQLLNADFVEAEMRHRVEDAKEIAEAIAPIDERSSHPGRYKASFYVRSGTHGGDKHNRAWARLGNDAPEALLVEYGSRNNKRSATLRRAMRVI